MPFKKVDPIEEARELQKVFNDNSEAKALFREYELAHMAKRLDYYMGLSYRVEVIEDKEEGDYTLHCPELKGCITCAETLEKGFEMLEDAKKCWFEACIEDGIPIPKPTEGAFNG